MIALVLDALAAYRLTRLATADTILAGPRDTLVRRAYARAEHVPRAATLAVDEGVNLAEPGGWAELAPLDPYAPKVATLVTCRWCASAWIGMLVVCMRRWCPKAWDPVAKGLSFSAVATLLARLEN